MDPQLSLEDEGQRRLFPGLTCRQILTPAKTLHASGKRRQLYNPLDFEQPFALKLHRAQKYHFDVRLCYHWIALSWAVYSMPSHCPAHSCVATQVEDHLRDNLLFEGVHAGGRPGAGPTIVVDMGTWQPLPESLDIEASLHSGHLRFAFNGGLLHGVWSLTRLPECYRQDNPRWVLAKEKDEYALRHDPAESMDWRTLRSCCSGRKLEEIESDWHLGIRRFRRGDSLPFAKSVE